MRDSLFKYGGETELKKHIWKIEGERDDLRDENAALKNELKQIKSGKVAVIRSTRDVG